MKPPAPRSTAVEAGLWSAVDVFVRQGALFVVSIILARLLAPEDFGTMALLALFTGLSIVFVQGGLCIAIIQRQQTTSDEESAIFWWNFVASMALAAGIVLAGPSLAAFFRQPLLRPLVFVAAAQLIFSAGGGVHTALLTRQMRFDVLTKASLFASLGSGVVAVAAAMMGAGVWALALQIVTLAFLNTVALWCSIDWRPRLHFQFRTIRDLFGFGAWVSVGNVMEVIYANGFTALIGKLHGVRELGYYNQASVTQLLPSSALSTIIGRVSLPLLASNQDDPAAMRSSLRLAIRCVMLVNLPAMTGLALLSDLTVRVLFGDRWLPAAPILSILALGGILLPLHIINLQLVLARRQTARFMRNEMIKKSLGIACVIIGSLFGIVGLAWSQVVYSILGFVVNATTAKQNLDYGPMRQIQDLGGIFAMTSIMAAILYLLRLILPTGPLPTLAICTLAGAAFYGAAGWLSASTVFRDAVVLLSDAFARRKVAAGG